MIDFKLNYETINFNFIHSFSYTVKWETSKINSYKQKQKIQLKLRYYVTFVLVNFMHYYNYIYGLVPKKFTRHLNLIEFVTRIDVIKGTTKAAIKKMVAKKAW